jgi:ubiquitin-protein ligase
MVDVSRVQKELTECNHGRQVSGVSIELHNGANISHLIGTITAPANSPYEGGTFTIDIRLPGEPPVPLQSLPPTSSLSFHWIPSPSVCLAVARVELQISLPPRTLP